MVQEGDKVPSKAAIDFIHVVQRFHTDESRLQALKYQPKGDDVFLVAPPKCGVTWLQQVETCCVCIVSVRGSLAHSLVTV